jgi:hypothetical protein
MVKLVAFTSTALLMLLVSAIAVYLRFSGAGPRHETLDTPAVVNEIRRLNELATVRYSIEKVVAMREEKSPVGSESILLLVQGRVVAGVDLAELKASDITFSKPDAVQIHLAPPRIQECYLDEKYTKVWDRSITWWTPWVTPDADLEHKARLQALHDINAAALEMGILAEAKRNAEIDIGAILQALGIGKVDVYYGS